MVLIGYILSFLFSSHSPIHRTLMTSKRTKYNWYQYHVRVSQFLQLIENTKIFPISFILTLWSFEKNTLLFDGLVTSAKDNAFAKQSFRGFYEFCFLWQFLALRVWHLLLWSNSYPFYDFQWITLSIQSTIKETPGIHLFHYNSNEVVGF